MHIKYKPLDQLIFDNHFIQNLPADKETKNYRRQVTSACYSYVKPAEVSNPRLVAYASDVAKLLDLNTKTCESQQFTDIFVGNELLPNMKPYAMCYGGHQFGNWAGQLGDGRAINLGEIRNHANQHWTLQLKGAGPTPYSRSADGLAVLRSSLREFLCSEAMHHLGVPTTRALSLILTGEHVTRDMFYDGNAKAEQGAVVCRVAPSFVRFGNFQLLSARNEFGLLRKLVDTTIRHDFPHLLSDNQALDKTLYIKWFNDICHKTADMIIHWQRVGFVHGVMNTDNMSILGLTIDYGPYGWLDNYDPEWTPNTTDASHRRYRYGQQPQIALWNLLQLANALYPLIEDDKPFQQALNTYNQYFEKSWEAMMAKKLGLQEFITDNDEALVSELLEILAAEETDMTIFYRQLALINADSEQNDTELLAPLRVAWYQWDTLSAAYLTRVVTWLREYCQRLQQDNRPHSEKCQAMNKANPKYILRNYLSQQAIDKAEQGDFSMVTELLALIRHPYDEQPEQQHYATKRPDWAKHKAGCSMLSCSS